MTTHRIRFEGPSLLALDVATTLADAKGIEMTASEPPTQLRPGVAALVVTVDGAPEVVADAVEEIRQGLPEGASIELLER